MRNFLRADYFYEYGTMITTGGGICCCYNILAFFPKEQPFIRYRLFFCVNNQLRRLETESIKIKQLFLRYHIYIHMSIINIDQDMKNDRWFDFLSMFM